MHAVQCLKSCIKINKSIELSGNSYLFYIYLYYISNSLLLKIQISPMLEDIELVDITLQPWMIRIYIKMFWYKNIIHKFIFGAMMSCYIQFGIITNTLV